MANVVGERFQITIAREVRKELGIKPGDLAVERVVDGRLVIDFVPKPHRESQFGIFHRPGVEPITDWQAVRERAWSMRTAEIMDVLRRDSQRHREDR